MEEKSFDLQEYEREIFLDFVDENGLLVLCEGLGLERITINFLRLYCELEHELVIVLNTDANQQKYYIEKLKNFNVSKLPTILSSDILAAERKNLYLNGGVYFASSQIFVMDFLVDRIPIHLISGVIVTKAHYMADAYLEPFILRLYRTKNKTGFIKAFTDKPVSLCRGFSQLDRVMKNLFVGKVFLYPRFHKTVLKCLEKNQPEVLEIEVGMTREMRKIQSSILEIVSACIRELKSDNPGIEAEEFTVENSLGRSFDRIIRHQLDPVWNELGPKTKHLVNDLRMLRLLLRALSQYDCVTFLRILENSIGGQKFFGKNPGWIFLDAADQLFAVARKRVFGENKSSKNVASLESAKLESCPKWAVLTQVMDEVREGNEKTNSSGKVLIFCGDMRSYYMIKDVLTTGCQQTLNKIFQKTFMKMKTPATGSSKGKQSVSADEDDVVVDDSEELIGATKVIDNPETHVHTLHGGADFYQLNRILDHIEPRYVILYDVSLHVVRQLEVYKASRPGIPLRIMFITYQSSTEEQIYLTALRKEKEAFRQLISEKSTMVVPKEREGKLMMMNDDATEKAYQIPSETRKADKFNKKEDEVKKMLIVDVREFRSELPSLIHSRGIELQPITVEVGDYILTPDICVERKSLSDLIGSLNSGRLYTQCVNMTRSYKQAILMIEFDANKSFSFKARGVTNRISLKELNQKLTLLLLHFPTLRLAWCSSPLSAAILFADIKKSRENPDPQKVAAVRGDDDIGNGKYNFAPQDFLLKLPGVNAKNCMRIMKKVASLLALTKMSENEISEILDSKVNGKLLHDFLHLKHNDKVVDQPRPPSSNKLKRSKLFNNYKPSAGSSSKMQKK